MNPVDVSFLCPSSKLVMCSRFGFSLSLLMVVVTTSTSARPLPWLAEPYLAKRLVSSLPGVLVCSVVPKRQKIRWWVDSDDLWAVRS